MNIIFFCKAYLKNEYCVFKIVKLSTERFIRYPPNNPLKKFNQSTCTMAINNEKSEICEHNSFRTLFILELIYYPRQKFENGL